ncbi:hypothetical protein L1285_16685 [Pseudoalteromonas sp. DL2-H2.2]|uniref:helix-turn-helix domain-containing protein n=1 Tax=Pseudoalteromonas sp. DL2-H2.2 TaxID=2908889 RepID=UPI001F29F5D2|nr:helix-turn-helix domain-containing protein [Pseudoalteromonas sp. DL2-H2.2]MCF2909960.1 hypothetical protein [Pseudoalteromonas sp. DL2-H2.2]
MNELTNSEQQLKTALRAYVREHGGNGDLIKTIKGFTIDETLVLTRGNQSKAARTLGINRLTIRMNRGSEG